MCNPLSPGCVVGKVGKSAASGALDYFVQKLSEGLNTMFKWMATAWFQIPSPTLEGNSVITNLWSNLSYVTGVIAILGFMFGITRAALEVRGQPLADVSRMLVTLVAVSGFGLAAVGAMVTFGDAFAPWVVQQATGEQFSASSLAVIVNPATLQQNVALGLILGVLLVFATLMQILFIICRNAMLIVQSSFLPPVAAGTATPDGLMRFKRFCSFFIGFILYKPVAAIVYAAGLKLMHNNDQKALNLVYGLVVITLAALALPAMIRFFVPMAAVGSSNMFSGGAAVGAIAATGAAVVTLGAGAATGVGGGAAAGASASGASPTPRPGGGGPPTPPGGGGGGGSNPPGGSGGGMTGPATAATGDSSPTETSSSNSTSTAGPAGMTGDAGTDASGTSSSSTASSSSSTSPVAATASPASGSAGTSGDQRTDGAPSTTSVVAPIPSAQARTGGESSGRGSSAPSPSSSSPQGSTASSSGGRGASGQAATTSPSSGAATPSGTSSSSSRPTPAAPESNAGSDSGTTPAPSSAPGAPGRTTGAASAPNHSTSTPAEGRSGRARVAKVTDAAQAARRTKDTVQIVTEQAEPETGAEHKGI